MTKPARTRTMVYKHAPVIVVVLTLLFNFATSQKALAQSDSSIVNHKRLRTFVIGAGAGYVATMVGLNQLWYKDAPKQSFQFFNDNAEWKQVDKLGHFFSAYYFSYGTSKALKWSNVSSTKADLAGAITGFAVLLPIEIFDGYSAAYGASSGDLLANAGGALFFLGQQRLWNEQRLFPKFSFRQTGYAPMRPEVLGESGISEIFKDYNGQTYWISADMDKFIRIPKWLNIAFGYGADGMFYARDNENYAAGYTPRRQFYLSIDPDLTAIRSRSKAIKTLIFIAGMIKLPSPTLQWSKGQIAFHSFHY